MRNSFDPIYFIKV